MGYPFPNDTQAVSSLPLLSLLFLFLHISTACPNTSSFKFQPTIQEHEELVCLAGNLKLEVTQYLKDLYGLEVPAYLGNYDDDHGEDLEVTSSYQPRKRHFR